jgi:hypothetical protein
MVSTVWIVPIPLDLFRRNENVFSILSPFGKDVAVDVPDLGWIAVRIIATASVRMIGHMPRRIEFLVQGHILKWMVPCNVIFSILCLGRHRQSAAQGDSEKEFA